MEAIECIKTRRSIRKFLDKAVEWDKIIDIIYCGILAPNAGNLQNWKFVYITDPAKKQAIAEACLKQHWIADAPVILVIYANPEKARQFYGVRGERLYAIQNCAAAAENILLGAHALGLGACWVGAFDEEMLNDTMEVNVKQRPHEPRPQVVIPIGYADEEPPFPGRLIQEQCVHVQGYDNRRRNRELYYRDFSVFMAKKINLGKHKANKKLDRFIKKMKERFKKGEA